MAKTLNEVEVASPFYMGPAYRYIRKSDKLPTEIGSSEDDVILKVRLFNPTGVGTWWIASYDPDTGNAFGVAEITDREIGSFSLPELMGFRGLFGLAIERDLHCTPVSILKPSPRVESAQDWTVLTVNVASHVGWCND